MNLHTISNYGKGIRGQLYDLVQEVKPRHWNSSWDSWDSLGRDIAYTGFDKFKEFDEIKKLKDENKKLREDNKELSCDNALNILEDENDSLRCKIETLEKYLAAERKLKESRDD